MGATPGAATGRQGRAMELPETVMELPETVMGLPETVTELRGRAMVHRETATGLQETVLRLQGRAEERGRAGVPGRARGAQGKGGGRAPLPGDCMRDPAAGGRGPTPGVAGPHLPGPPRGTGAGVQWHGGLPLLLLTPGKLSTPNQNINQPVLCCFSLVTSISMFVNLQVLLSMARTASDCLINFQLKFFLAVLPKTILSIH